jgi:hypothetical protein
MSAHMTHMNRAAAGSSLVEVVVAAAVLASVALAFLGSFALISRLHERNMDFVKGELLAEEGLEAVRFVRASNWPALSSSVGSTKYLSLGPSSWSLSSTPEIVDGAFYRSIAISEVRRDASDDIVASGGSVDPSTLLVQSSVSWRWRGATSTVSYQAYITNI